MDPLTAATTAELIPIIRPHGFQRRSTRLFGRLGECAFQLLHIQKSSYGGGDFCVDYASMMLFPPEDNIVLQPGNRLERARGRDAWWPAASHEQAQTSMGEVAHAVVTQALPFFNATRSASGLYAYLMKDDWGSRHHLELARGTCLAWMGDVARARKHLEHAARLY